MLCQEVQNYLNKAIGLPFFYVVGDENYKSVLGDLKLECTHVGRMSDFCPKNDKFPDMGKFVDFLHTADVDHKTNKCVVLGVGEYLALRGEEEANRELRRLKNITIGSAKVILLLRGVSSQARKIIEEDRRIQEQQRAYICDNTFTDISITNIQAGLGLVKEGGIKHLLAELEDGAFGNREASTSILLNNSFFPVHVIGSAYAAVHYLAPSITGASLGTEEQWKELLKDLYAHNKNINNVFNHYGINEISLNTVDNAFLGDEYALWLHFLYAKLHTEHIQNAYHKLVVEQTPHVESLKTNLLIWITRFSHTDSSFKELYNARKILLNNSKCFSEGEIAEFIKKNEVNPKESIYRLTDNTELEKEAIIRHIASYGISDAISYVYPDLYEYLKDYTFTCTHIGSALTAQASQLCSKLTEYFNAYKQQKVLNTIFPEFMNLVDKYSSLYARLPARDGVIKHINQKHAYLYWIDALGVEYLSYITYLAKEKGLSIHVNIARADLPTITSINNQFFEDWQGPKHKEKRLDAIKHKDDGGYFFTKDDTPVHLAKELEIIKEVMNNADVDLKGGKYKAFVIASDHGASRLAVIKKQEVKYETDTQGEHSGRCCKVFDGCDVPCAVRENGYIVLSDYGRFRGSRAANVEVHGGASLEEVLVPIITLTLKNQADVDVRLADNGDIFADKNTGVAFTVYISFVDNPGNVSLTVKGKNYPGTRQDDTHYIFHLSDIKRSGTYNATVYDGQDEIKTLPFTVKSRIGTENADFDFDF